MALPNPEARLQSLPPILRRTTRKSLPSCSKGSWGLSVFPRVEGIFTPNVISLSPWSRQCGCCYALVQVGTYPTRNFATLGPLLLRPPFTGASVQCFACADISPKPSSTGQASDPIRRLTTSQSPVFLVNSHNRHFTATTDSFVTRSH